MSVSVVLSGNVIRSMAVGRVPASGATTPLGSSHGSSSPGSFTPGVAVFPGGPVSTTGRGRTVTVVTSGACLVLQLPNY